MGRTCYAKAKKGHGNKVMRHFKTKRYRKDVDEIIEDLEPAKREKLQSQPVDLDIAGGAQHYCVSCARHFISEAALKTHFSSKPHKRRLKKLETEPYTQEEADRAAGMGSYQAPKQLHTVIQLKNIVEKSKTENMEAETENKT